MTTPDTAAPWPATGPESRSRSLYRRAREIHELAMIARDCTVPGRGRNLDRAERLLTQIAALARP